MGQDLGKEIGRPEEKKARRIVVPFLVAIAVVSLSVTGYFAIRLGEADKALGRSAETTADLTQTVAVLEGDLAKLEAAYEVLLLTSQETEKKYQQEAESKPSPHPLDVEFDRELQQWSGVTQEGVNIYGKYARMWEEEMEHYYEKIYELLDEEKRQWLEHSQSVWEEARAADEELWWQAYDQRHHMGTIMRIYEGDIFLNRYRSRAKCLEEICIFLESDY